MGKKMTVYVFQCTVCGTIKNYPTKLMSNKHCGQPMRLVNVLSVDEKDAPPLSPCYITTATCTALMKGDDCDELQTFRRFRDTYMKGDNNLKVEVDEYYEIAPRIVEAIEMQEDKENIYKKIFYEYLSPAYEKIKTGSNLEAYKMYKIMVRDLKELYLRLPSLGD